MKTGVTTSVVAHAAVLIVAIVGLGSAKPYEPEVVESIAVDLVPISEFTNIRAGSLDSTIVETETPAIAESDKPAELAQPTGNTEKDQPTPQETAKETPAPVINTAPEPVPEVQPEPEPEPVVEPPPEPEPEAAPEPVAAPEETAPAPELAAPETIEAPTQVAPVPARRTASLDKLRADYKKELEQKKKDAAAKKKAEEEQKRIAEAKKEADKQAREADRVAALINNEDSRGATTGQGGTPTLGKNTGTAATLSQNEMAMLKAHVSKCINPPIGAAEEGASVQLTFSLSRNFQVVGSPQIISVIGPSTGSLYARAASRAVVRCQSVDGGYAFLPPDKYDGASGWNTVKVTFNANETF
jgi:colicin import membrane protein